MEQSQNKTKNYSDPTSIAVTESFTFPNRISDRIDHDPDTLLKANDTKLRIRNAITQLELLYRSLYASERIDDDAAKANENKENS